MYHLWDGDVLSYLPPAACWGRARAGIKSEDVLFVFNICVPVQEALGRGTSGSVLLPCWCQLLEIVSVVLEFGKGQHKALKVTAVCSGKIWVSYPCSPCLTCMVSPGPCHC